ncbi:MAG: hypothetical protein ABIN45_01705, partial [Gammaproteobacteria bacterium]
MDEDRQPILRECWISAPLLLLVSATLLITASLQFIAWRAPSQPPTPIHWTGAELNLVEGKGHKQQNTLTAEALSDNGLLITSASPINVEATDYSTVRVEISGAA